MHQITLSFHTEDEGLNLTGTVNFPDRSSEAILSINSLSIRGLAEWRHVPANIIHISKEVAERLNMLEKSVKLSKVGVNWIGLQAHTDILLAHAVRKGRNGSEKVQKLLTKFFKALGASSLKFDSLEQPEDDDNGNEADPYADGGNPEVE